eukprot:3700231-Karenia_brevis.AAC.1
MSAQVLPPTGVTVGTCVSALNYSVPKDVQCGAIVSDPKSELHHSSSSSFITIIIMIAVVVVVLAVV